MNHHLFGLVEDLEGCKKNQKKPDKNRVSIKKETLRLHLHSLILLWYFVAFLQAVLWLTCLNTHVFKVSLTSAHSLLRAPNSLKHSLSSAQVSWHVPQLTCKICWQSELHGVLLIIKQHLHLPWGTWNPHTAKCQHVWPENTSVKVLLTVSAESWRGSHLLDAWHTFTNLWV